MPRPVAIEVTENDAKVVQLFIDKKGDVQLESAFRLSFEDLPRAEEGMPQRVQRLKEALKQHRLSTEEAALVVPKQSATVRKVRLPSADPSELASMIVFEAEKIIPFNVERHIISHQLLRQNEIEGSDVLIAAVDEPVMQQWYGLLKGAGVDPATSVVSSMAAGYGLMKSLPEAEARKSIGVLSIGTSYTDIGLFSEQMMVATRSVKHGVRPLLDELNPPVNETMTGVDALARLNVSAREKAAVPRAESDASDHPAFEVIHEPHAVQDKGGSAIHSWIGKLATHLQRTYEFALREYTARPLEKIYITGEGALIPHLPEALNARLGVPVEVYNPLSKLPRAPKGRVEDEMLAAFGTAYGAALQLGLEDPEEIINLLPQSVIDSRRRSELRLHYIATGTLALIAAVVLFLVFETRSEISAEEVDRLRTYKRDLDELVQNSEGMRDRISIIREIRSERAGALQILEALSQYNQIGTFPAGRVSLDSFSFSINDQVRISGQAIETDDMNRFLQYLRTLKTADGESNIFESADIVSQEPKPLAGRDRTVYRFDIVATLRSQGRR